MTTDGLAIATARLREEFVGIFSPETIEELVADSANQMASTARVQSFVALLSERFARERLRASLRLKEPS
jgi:hypothetical protein